MEIPASTIKTAKLAARRGRSGRSQKTRTAEKGVEEGVPGGMSGLMPMTAWGLPLIEPDRQIGKPGTFGLRPASGSRGRKVPENIDRTVRVGALLFCPPLPKRDGNHPGARSSYIQEDISLVPRTVVTSYIHDTAFCPGCRCRVIRPIEGELPFAPMGPDAKAAALYLRHALKVPYQKISEAMSSLFGIAFVRASGLGFERRAGANARPIYRDLLDMFLALFRSSPLHAHDLVFPSKTPPFHSG